MVLSFPVLVTSRPVVEAEPDGADVHMRQVPWSRIVRTGRLFNNSLVVEVVHQPALDQWLTERLVPSQEQVVAQLNAAAASYRRAATGDRSTTSKLSEIARKLT